MTATRATCIEPPLALARRLLENEQAITVGRFLVVFAVHSRCIELLLASNERKICLKNRLSDDASHSRTAS